jgi:hypothetical protein
LHENLTQQVHGARGEAMIQPPTGFTGSRGSGFSRTTEVRLNGSRSVRPSASAEASADRRTWRRQVRWTVLVRLKPDTTGGAANLNTVAV